MIRQVAKYGLSRLAPGYWAELKARRARAHSEELEREWGCSELTEKIIAEHGPGVIRGPFAGVEYVAETHHRHLTPKLIGAYEEELHPTWEKVNDKDYTQILNVGCADGCYAIGLSLHYPHIGVMAFDTDRWARRVNRLMARHNRVENLTVYGACTREWLQDNLQGGSFILSDCEGFEDQLLDPQVVPALRYCDLLIELHEPSAPGVSDRMSRRYRGTHNLTFVEAQKSDPTDYPELRGLSKQEQRLAVSDLRSYGNQTWLYAEVR